MLEVILPYAVPFVSALVLSLVLTPLVREFNRRLGMVDKPDARRINKTPIPRGGGLAVVVAVAVTYAGWSLYEEHAGLCSDMRTVGWRMLALAGAIAALGLVDDRYSLRPRVKLAGQVVIAILTWALAGIGFRNLCPWLPAPVDAVLTVFWLVGAVNAFNLIDGLDGLASGIGLIASLGMAGSLIFVGAGRFTVFHFTLAGALLGFLRYNYNPASVFLGDCGSMYIGFSLAVLPLAAETPNSFLVSVGVPLLAMGVPIFDTALAIVRRTLRRILRRNRGSGAAHGSDHVMTADVDHLHHRILRNVGLNQRKAAWTLYAFTLALVLIGQIGLVLQSRAAGLWILAVAAAAIVIFRDAARIELFYMGRILCGLARDGATAHRRRFARLTVPFYLVFDLLSLVGSYFLVCRLLWSGCALPEIRVEMPIRVFSTFALLIFFRTYVTAWARAFGSNYARLALACALGAVIGSVTVYYAPCHESPNRFAFAVMYAALTFGLLAAVRMVRGLVRDFFYSLDCARLVARKDTSRLLVYGSGLRYRAFRRELIRKTDANNRIIVGLLDDDLLLRGHYIGGIKIEGTLLEAPEIINRLNVDTVIVACEMTEEWKRIVRQTLEPTGVKIVQFSFSESPL